ncbi:hypothetical protein D9M72_552230 [compost metagenome]
MPLVHLAVAQGERNDRLVLQLLAQCELAAERHRLAVGCVVHQRVEMVAGQGRLERQALAGAADVEQLAQPVQPPR